MSGVETVFFCVGVFTGICGAIALCGLVLWQGLEWWVRANELGSVLMAFYADRLKKARTRTPG